MGSENVCRGQGYVFAEAAVKGFGSSGSGRRSRNLHRNEKEFLEG